MRAEEDVVSKRVGCGCHRVGRGGCHGSIIVVFGVEIIVMVMIKKIANVEIVMVVKV